MESRQQCHVNRISHTMVDGVCLDCEDKKREELREKAFWALLASKALAYASAIAACVILGRSMHELAGLIAFVGLLAYGSRDALAVHQRFAGAEKARGDEIVEGRGVYERTGAEREAVAGPSRPGGGDGTSLRLTLLRARYSWSLP